MQDLLLRRLDIASTHGYLLAQMGGVQATCAMSAKKRKCGCNKEVQVDKSLPTFRALC